jgi:mannosyltransferase
MTRQLSAAIGRLPHNLLMWTVLFCVLGGALRFAALGKQGLWSDELHGVELAGRDLLAIWENSRVDLHPPLYYALVYILLQGLPPTEANVRLLSAISSLAAIPILGIYLERNYGRAAAIAGMLFLTLSPVQIYYAQEARAYAMSVLWTGLSLLA